MMSLVCRVLKPNTWCQHGLLYGLKCRMERPIEKLMGE